MEARNDDSAAAVLTNDEQLAWRSFLRGTSLLLEQLNQDMERSCGLALNEFEVLAALSEAPTRRVRMSKLADDLVHSRSRLTHTVRRLENKGFVERVRCKEDGRGIFCRLTDAGLAKFEQSSPHQAISVRERLVQQMTNEEFMELGRIYRKVLGWGDDGPEPPSPDDFCCRPQGFRREHGTDEHRADER
ncbi:MAG: MarR family transcriptional regulator [Actinomycetaceae bacterium]|nr:MarR family transcriptional regulator [Arcanobacterium sp.]MDD7686986.1 MarR family transcriptional regulator [Actinomycetaceae bacterium]MDY5273359.1 MarR family transcriptional regulator [Arcanobacterium sp.]